MSDGEVRAEARRAARMASREMLLEILASRHQVRRHGDPPESAEQKARRRMEGFAMSAARQELVNRYACSDCGAVAGRECYTSFGCLDSSREKVAGVRCLSR